MKLDIPSFKGEAPRLTPRLLPETAAQSAVNCRMETGDLASWRQFVAEKTLAASATTIYKLNGQWLSWNAQVDVARGLIPGDTSFFTFLTAPGFYSEPRYTTFSLATTGAEPYPVATLPLGMPAPTVAPTLTAGVDTTPTTTAVTPPIDEGGELATAWSKSTLLNGSGIFSNADESAATGNPDDCYFVQFRANVAHPAYLYKSFGIGGNSVASVSVDLAFTVQSDGSEVAYCDAETVVMATPDGAGVAVEIHNRGAWGAPPNPGTFVMTIGKSPSWTTKATALDFVSVGTLTVKDDGVMNASPPPTDPDNWYRLTVDIVSNESGTKTVTATLRDGVTVLGTLTVTNTFDEGDYVGFKGIGVFQDPTASCSFDNIEATASGPNGFVSVSQATSYLYTFIGANSWESAPGPVSATILRADGVSVAVETPTTHAHSSDYGITSKAIYRSVTGATGTVFFLVAVIPLLTAVYDDVLSDAAITNPGTPLETEDWDLPSTELEGIIALPNNCMAGFFRNQLCFSAAGRPHAWPVRYRLTTDTDIVAIANIDNTIIIGTEKFVYTATGNDPASYSMSQPGEPQACVSKLSMTYVDGFGVVFASPDGFQVCAGSAGNVKNATAGIFTKEQWEALNPSSIISKVYDGNLFFWFNGSAPDAGYLLDTKQDGAGLVSLAHHAVAAHVDPLTDSLFVVLDQNNEPTEALLPVASTAVTPSGTAIFKFDAHASNRVRYSWKGKLNLMPHETTFHFAKVEAADFTNLAFRVYGNGTLIYTKQVTSSSPFRIPGQAVYDSYEVEVVGTSRVRTIQLAQHIEEFT